MKISRYIDHAILKPGMTHDEIVAAIKLGVELDVYSVCMQPRDVKLACEMCKGTNTHVGSVIDFPHGAGGAEAKRAISRFALDQGAEELDMVMNYSAARSGMWDVVLEEIKAVVEEGHAKNAIVKVIFETSELNEEQIRKAVEVSIEAGADFVKTSTGFTSTGATVEGVAIMVDQAKGRIKVKASGGIRDYAGAKKFVDMGVERLGIGCTGSGPVCTGEGENTDNY
ncbi:MAG: deoxyribose-phosphate aldolase [Clostridia bacterium]|nr:deoxyribose-phosphate aldolase [Clostridia bacterium]